VRVLWLGMALKGTLTLALSPVERGETGRSGQLGPLLKESEMRNTLLVLAVAAVAIAGEKWPESAELIVKGLKFTEGPAWSPQGFLLFSDIPANRIYRWEPGKEPAIFRDPSNNSNGLAIDRQGRLIACEHGARRVTRTEADGKVTILAEKFEGKRLNSPNDLTLHSDGSVYFTDPPYGVKAEERELDFAGVYRLGAEGRLTLLVKDLRRPNGIGLSPDEKRLYVDDSEAKTVHAYDLQPDGTVGKGRLLINLGDHGTRGLDGLKVDIEGNLYVTGTDAVYVVGPDGKLLAKIPCPGQCTNCCFGEADRKTLFVAARTKEGGGLYRVRVPIAGHSPK